MTTADKQGVVKSSRNRYLFPFLMVATLFFIWGFCHSLLDDLNKYFQDMLSLGKMESGLVQTSVFIAYFLVGLPAAMLIRRIGYQRGILVGLLVLATGAFLFIPAGLVFQTFWAFLAALFVLSIGLATIETAANPYVTVLGPKEGAAGRLSVAQAFNACAYILAPAVGGFILFGKKIDPNVRDFHPLILPYAVLGLVVLLIFGAFAMIHLPVIEEGKADEADDATIFKAPLASQPHFTLGVVTQFLYIVAQIGVNAFAVNYIVENAVNQDAKGNITSAAPVFQWLMNITNAKNANQAATYVIAFFCMTLYTIGRFSGAPISRVIKPNIMLALYGILNSVVILLAIADVKFISWMILPLCWLFMSIMYPFIFAMSVRNLGPQTKIAASFHVIAVGAAGSISAVLMGGLWDHYKSVGLSFSVPLICFVAVTIYALAYPALLEKSGRAAPATAK